MTASTTRSAKNAMTSMTAMAEAQLSLPFPTEGEVASAIPAALPTESFEPTERPASTALVPDAPQPETAVAWLATLNAWTDHGWLRRLDSAMARFMTELDPAAAPTLLVAAALLTHMEGRGHTCLALAPLLARPQDTLAWPAEAQSPFQQAWSRLPATLADWLNALRTSPLVRKAMATATSDPDHGQPLVLGGTPQAPLLYLRRYWGYEEQVAAGLAQATAQPLAVDVAQARRWLDALFERPSTVTNTAATGTEDPTSATTSTATTTTTTKAAAATPATPATPGPGPDWQKAACALALRGRLTVITGGPGTGKTYTAARLLALLLAMHPQPESLKVSLAAPTGKAAARLRQSIDQSLADLQQRLGSALDLAALTQRMGPAKTVHALLGARPGTRQLTHHAANPLDVDVLIVDETSMVHLEMMAALLQALPPTARLVVLGDKDQLASVEAGAVLGDLCAHAEQPAYSPDTVAFVRAASGEVLPGAAFSEGGAEPDSPPLAQHTVMLRHSQRFGGTIGALAQAVNAGQAAQAHALFNQDHTGAIWLAPTAQATPDAVLALAVGGRAQAPASYADYAALLAQQPPAAPAAQAAPTGSLANPATAAPASHAGPKDDPAHQAHTAWVKAVLRAWDHFRVLCAVHDGPWGDRELNRGIQRALAQAGWLKPEGEWYVGRPVMVTRNDAALGVFNGDVGVVLPSATGGKALRAWFLDGDHLRSVAVSRLAHVDTAFAMTVHKSQGSEFLHTVLVLPPGGGEVMSRELIYTGITRARTHFSLVEAEPGLLAAAIRQRLARASGLPLRLAQPLPPQPVSEPQVL